MKRIKKNHIIITALAIMIAAAGYINYAGDLDNIIKVKDDTFLCKKTSSFNFDDICDMFSNVGCSYKTIIISPGYNYDFSSPYFEVKCTV